MDLCSVLGHVKYWGMWTCRFGGAQVHLHTSSDTQDHPLSQAVSTTVHSCRAAATISMACVISMISIELSPSLKCITHWAGWRYLVCLPWLRGSSAFLLWCRQLRLIRV